MSSWTEEELRHYGAADEVHIASLRADGSSRKPVIVWVVRRGDDLYTRSVNGPDAAWFRGTRVQRVGHIEAGGVVNDVAFVDADPALNDDLDIAYRTKYARYPGPVDRIVSPLARSATLRLTPQPKEKRP